jgi:hypothetical protein
MDGTPVAPPDERPAWNLYGRRAVLRLDEEAGEVGLDKGHGSGVGKETKHALEVSKPAITRRESAFIGQKPDADASPERADDPPFDDVHALDPDRCRGRIVRHPRRRRQSVAHSSDQSPSILSRGRGLCPIFTVRTKSDALGLIEEADELCELFALGRAEMRDIGLGAPELGMGEVGGQRLLHSVVVVAHGLLSF